jgi:hypothetical protein
MTRLKHCPGFSRRLKVFPALQPGAVKIVPPLCASSTKYDPKTPFRADQLLAIFELLKKFPWYISEMRDAPHSPGSRVGYNLGHSAAIRDDDPRRSPALITRDGSVHPAFRQPL